MELPPGSGVVIFWAVFSAVALVVIVKNWNGPRY